MRAKRFWRVVGVVVAGWAAFAGAAPGAAGDAEEGFESLFNGKDLSGWDGKPAMWSVRDGAITGQSTKPMRGNTFLIWKAGVLADFELRLSFRIFGGNSGIQFRSRDRGRWVVSGYQADVDAANRYTGILYEEKGRGFLARLGQRVVIDPAGRKEVVGKTADPARIKAAVKAKDWNEYVITARGGHIVQKINGLVTVDVTDNQPARRALSGILALQLHAGAPMKVQFKDLRLKRLKPAPATQPAKGDAGWQDLFNGKDLTGWKCDPNAWRVERGEMVCGSLEGKQPQKSICYRRQKGFGDFEAEFDMKLLGDAETAHSGFQFRTKIERGGRAKSWRPTNGYEACGGPFWGSLFERFRLGPDGKLVAGRERLHQVPPGKWRPVVKAGDWNRFHVTAAGARIQVRINGTLLTDYTDPKGAGKGEGVAFQLHGPQPMQVRIRNVRVRDLSRK